MADFTVIETQEQLDKIIADRLRRAEKQYAEKYADYDAIKAQLAQYAEGEKKHKATVDELTAKIHQYETASVKTKVALEVGLPYQMASRLTGDDEKAIRADAESMLKLIGNNKPAAPLGSSEPNTKNSETSAWASMSASLSNT